jgi:lipid-binding SYLF domain-containing protein
MWQHRDRFSAESMRMQNLRFLISLAVVSMFAARPATLLAADREEATVLSAADSLAEIMRIPASGIPAALLKDAEAVAIVPNVIKASFVVGGRRGHGVVVLRDANGRWANPLFVTLTGGSVGWQIGIQSTDVFLVFKTKRSLDGFLRGRKFTLGADAAVAAGPIGRQAEAGTDGTLQAEILSYSRSRGLFAGVSLEGSVIEADVRGNATYYRLPPVTPELIIAGQVQTPASAIKLREQLTAASGMPAVRK